MKKLFTMLALAGAMLGSVLNADACTNFIVTRGASTDGSNMVTYAADSHGKDSPDKSLVTIEVRDNVIVQALQRFNNPLTKEQQEIVDKWNKWRANKVKETEREELKNAG